MQIKSQWWEKSGVVENFWNSLLSRHLLELILDIYSILISEVTNKNSLSDYRALFEFFFSWLANKSIWLHLLGFICSWKTRLMNKKHLTSFTEFLFGSVILGLANKKVDLVGILKKTKSFERSAAWIRILKCLSIWSDTFENNLWAQVIKLDHSNSNSKMKKIFELSDQISNSNSNSQLIASVQRINNINLSAFFLQMTAEIIIN